jgi:hypothetical protein
MPTKYTISINYGEHELDAGDNLELATRLYEAECAAAPNTCVTLLAGEEMIKEREPAE